MPFATSFYLDRRLMITRAWGHIKVADVRACQQELGQRPGFDPLDAPLALIDRCRRGREHREFTTLVCLSALRASLVDAFEKRTVTDRR
jgi:hypothetical protein